MWASGPSPSRIRSSALGRRTRPARPRRRPRRPPGPSSPRMRWTGRAARRVESSARSAMPKFECSWSGGTQRSSVNQKSTPDQSSRSAAARSYAARGVEPPVSARCPLAARQELGGRLQRGRRGRGCRRSPEQRLAAVERPAVGRGRAAAPAGCPRRGCRPRRARRRARSSSARCPSCRAGGRRSPPGPRSSEIDIPDAVSISTPASPGTLWSASGSSAQLDVVAAAVRAAAHRRRSPASACPALQPSRDASQPKKSTPADARVGAVADGDRVDPAQLVAPARRVERGGHPLAPGRRAQPGEVHDVRLARASSLRAPRAPRSGRARSRSPPAPPAPGGAARRPPRGARAATRPASGGRSRRAGRRSCRAAPGASRRRPARTRSRVSASSPLGLAADRHRRPTRRSSSRPGSTAHTIVREAW